MSSAKFVKNVVPTPAAERGGRGGLPSGNSGMKEEASSSILSKPADVQPLADALLSHGVFLLSSTKRLAVATALHEAGMTVEQFRKVAAWIEAGESDGVTARKYLASVCAKVDQFKEAAAAVAQYEQRAADRRNMRTSTHTWGFPAPYWSCGCSGCDALRRRGEADKGTPISFGGGS